MFQSISRRQQIVYRRETGMLNKHRGDSVLEWLALAILIVLILSAAVYTLATSSSHRGDDASKWINNMSGQKP